MDENQIATHIETIKYNIQQFVQRCVDCDLMITDRMEPTYRCRHARNAVGTCEWVFCPLTVTKEA